MWTYEHSLETEAGADALWRLYADVEGWAGWDPGIARVEPGKPFRDGTEVEVVPPGPDAQPANTRILEVREGRSWVNEVGLPGGLVARFTHTLAPLGAGGAPGNGTRVAHRLEISADDTQAARIGPALAEGIPATMQALVQHAEAADRQRGRRP